MGEPKKNKKTIPSKGSQAEHTGSVKPIPDSPDQQSRIDSIFRAAPVGIGMVADRVKESGK